MALGFIFSNPIFIFPLSLFLSPSRYLTLSLCIYLFLSLSHSLSLSLHLSVFLFYLPDIGGSCDGGVVKLSGEKMSFDVITFQRYTRGIILTTWLLTMKIYFKTHLGSSPLSPLSLSSSLPLPNLHALFHYL